MAVKPGLIVVERVRAMLEADPPGARLAGVCYPLDRIGEPDGGDGGGLRARCYGA
jgi:hypothetical protein